MTGQATLPLSRTEWAVAELGEIVCRDKSPEEVRELGWPNLAALMEQRREPIFEGEVE